MITYRDKARVRATEITWRWLPFLAMAGGGSPRRPPYGSPSCDKRQSRASRVTWHLLPVLAMGRRHQTDLAVSACFGNGQEEAARLERWKEEKPGLKQLIAALGESRVLIRKELARLRAEQAAPPTPASSAPASVPPGVKPGFNPIRCLTLSGANPIGG
jgi:hypothetical protein